MRNFLNFVWELVKVVAISIAIVVPIRYFIVQPFYVKGASMEPNFHDNEYLIIDEISYRFNEPKRGDIVVFRYPKNPQEYFIKRVIGLPGEQIQVKDGNVYLYNGYSEGKILIEDYLNPEIKTFSINENIIDLKPDEYFLLGDNRNSSKDSRTFGPVNRSFIIGKVFFRGWPFDEMSFFDTPKYLN